MKILKGKLFEESSRDLYWTRIIILSDDESKHTKIFVCSSLEYLNDLYRVPYNGKLTDENINNWFSLVVEKWSKLGPNIFDQDTHYDIYTNTKEGEINGLNFLIKKNN